MPMPYTLTKGPLLTLLENTLNPTDDAARTVRDNALLALRDPTRRLTSIPWVDPAAVAGVTLPQGAPLEIKLDRDWFGRSRNASGNWTDQPPFAGQTTGYWVGYYGEVEAVLREGLIRAIEVSLGIPHGGSPADAPRQWPVEIHWKCPNPYFEVWVSWRRHRAASGAQPEQGQVTVMIATPPDKVNRLVTEPRFPPDPPRPRRAQPLPEPTQATAKQGMWLVANQHHRQRFVDQLLNIEDLAVVDAIDTQVTTLQPMPADLWVVPTPTTFWEDQGPVVVVEPPANAGGAVANQSNAPA